MKVVDASAVVDLLLESPRGQRVDHAIDQDALTAPDLVYTEVLSALARRLRAGQLAPSDAERAQRMLVAMPVDVVPGRLLAARAWRLRERVRVTDGFYVACAELVRAPIISCDGRLSRAPLPGVTIIHIQ